MPKYFAGKARSLKLNSKGIPRNLLIWWLCKNGPLSTRFVCPWWAAMPCVSNSLSGVHGTGHVLSWPTKPLHTRTSFLLFFFFFAPSTPSRVTFGQKAQIVQPHLKKKHFKMLCQFPASPHPKNKMFCLVILCMHYFSRLVHKQMIVAFSCVSTASSTHSIEWADCSTLSIHSWSPTAACSQSKDVHVSSTSDTFKSQAFIFIRTNLNYFLLHKYNSTTYLAYHAIIYICYISNALQMCIDVIVLPLSHTHCHQSMWTKRSGVTLSSIFRFVGVRSAQSLTAKANAPLMFRSRSLVNQIPLRSRSDITFLQ